MSFIHYLGCDRPLPVHEEEDSPKVIVFTKEQSEDSLPLDLSSVSNEEIEVYETYEEAAGIYVTEAANEETVRENITCEYIYEIYANWGSFYVTEALKQSDLAQYKINEACVQALFSYLQQHLQSDDICELYTCWMGEEDKARNPKLDTFIRIKEFNMSDGFELKEGQLLALEI